MTRVPHYERRCGRGHHVRVEAVCLRGGELYVCFRYEHRAGSSGLWRRGWQPEQQMPAAQFERMFPRPT